MTANGYIPESGVWTAEERARLDRILTVTERDHARRSRYERTTAAKERRVLNTVAALIAALEDVLADTEHQGSTRRDAYDLLDAVK